MIWLAEVKPSWTQIPIYIIIIYLYIYLIFLFWGGERGGHQAFTSGFPNLGARTVSSHNKGLRIIIPKGQHKSTWCPFLPKNSVSLELHTCARRSLTPPKHVVSVTWQHSTYLCVDIPALITSKRVKQDQIHVLLFLHEFVWRVFYFTRGPKSKQIFNLYILSLICHTSLNSR